MALTLARGSLPGGRAFHWLLASDAIRLLSLMVGQVALPWWIGETGGAADLAQYGVVLALALLVGLPLLSPLGDRHPKRRLLGLGLAAHAVATLGFAALASSGHYQLGVILALTGLNTLAIALIGPLPTSMASELVPAPQLSDAIGLLQGAQSVGRLAGPALGGLLLAAAGTAGTLWCGGLLLLAAALLAWRVPDGAAAPAHPSAARKSWWQDLRDGLRANWAIPIERHWTFVNALSWLFVFPALTMLVPLKVQSLGLTGLWFGLCEAALSLGALVGAAGVSAWVVRLAGRYTTRVGAAVLQGGALALVGFTGSPLGLLVGFFLTGLTESAQALVGLTHRTLARPPAFRTRMFAVSAMTSQLAGSLGPAIAGVALAQGSTVQWTYTTFGLFGALASLALVLVPGFKAFMALDPAEVEGWYGRAHPEAFPPN